MRLIPLLALSLLATFNRNAPESPGAIEFEYGYFCALKPVATQKAQDTVSGDVSLVAALPQFIATGAIVPAQIGIGFGVKIRVQPGFTGLVTAVSEHPPMGPNGVTRQSWQTAFSDTEIQYAGYSFEHAYEVLPGTWTLSAQSNGRQIYRVSFDVVAPERLPLVSCGQTALSS